MLVVVGGGILGTLVVWHATRQGMRAVCVRRRDRPAPEAETLRNQAWLQSGLVPHRRIGRTAALRMWTQGRRMLEEFAFDPDEGDAGLLRVPQQLVPEFEQAIDDLVLRGRVPQIPEAVAQQRVGDFLRTGGIFYEIPDRPFPEGEIVELARNQALSTGLARFIELSGPARLRRVGQSIVVEADGAQLNGAAFVLAAGIGSLELLEDISHQHGMSASSTPLVVIKNASPLSCGLYADLESGSSFSVTRQTPSARTVDGALVLAGAPPAPLPRQWRGPRQVPRTHVDDVWRRVPPAAQALRNAFTNLHRMGIEPEREGLSKETPIVEEIAGCQNALFAFPGRATLAFSVAEEVVARLGTASALPATPSVTQPSSTAPWTAPVAMHFEDSYDQLDELV